MEDVVTRQGRLSPAKQALLEKRLRGQLAVQKQTLVRRERNGEPLPLSFAQQRLWFLDQLEPNSPFYNSNKTVRLSGPLNLEALERALNEIVRRHEILRSTFISLNGQPHNVVSPAQSSRLVIEDLAHLPTTEREAETYRLASEEALRPFNLSTGPVLRVKLLRLGEREHVILLTVHHIVSDAWSLGIFVRELAGLYQAFNSSAPSPLAELSIQYSDFALWQREWLQGEVLERELAYWRKQLGGELPVLELPTDHPRPAIQSYQGAYLPIRIPTEVAQALRELAQQPQCTLFMVLLAAFQALLFRLTSQEDVIVGTPIAGRNRAEIEPLIGFFINTLVLRTNVSGNPSFRELIGRVKEVALGAYAHQDVPFEKLVEELHPERDLSRSPLFQVMFSMQNVAADGAVETSGLRLSPVESKRESAKFDLTLSLTDLEEAITGTLEYNTDLFETATIERISERFLNLLRAVAADPDQRVGHVELLSAAEREQLLVEWNDTAVEQPRELCIQELFERQAALTPDAVAVVFGNEQLTYAELNRRANHLGHHLRSLGVGAETLVGLCVERSPELLVGLLGILKAGGAYVPLDPNYPAERLEYMLADAGLSVMVTQRQFATLMSESQCVVWMDDYAQPALAGENPALVTEPANLAYVIYTSGSSGRPKGVAITHAALVNHAQSMATHYELKATDRVLQFASLSFDVALEELFPTWASGGCVVMRTGTELTAAEFWTLVREHEISVVNLVTWYWQEVMEELGRREEALPSSLRLMVIGSERGRGAQLAVWSRLLPDGVRLMHGYGPTEATVTATVSEVGNREWDSAESLPIGRGIGNVEAYVLDQRQELVGVGIAGELYLGGAGVARGYLGRAAETAAQFVPDEWSGRAGARLYRTGDLAKWRGDGELEFIGRVDEQVKVRGYRVELGEIEAALLGHGNMREAVVVAREDRLVGYVVAEADELSTANLREYLMERLPSYMVPSVLVQLTELPLTPNGKVDRKALALRDDVGERAEESVLPRTAVEELLASIWSGVLRIEGVGIEENFFALGGHSLLATQVMSRVREVFGVEVPLRSLFEQPTVAGLGGKIEQALRGERGVAAPPLVRVSRDRELPLSFAQQRLWFLDQLEPESAFYNVPTGFRLIGDLDIAVLEQTLTEIVRRHEVLRTSFRSDSGQPRQVIAEPSPVSISTEDLSGLNEEERQRQVSRLSSEVARQPFDLSRGPLFRTRLLKLHEHEHIILLTMHHIVSDAWSMGILMHEFSALYSAYSVQQPSPLTELSIQYADFAVWQREWLDGDVLESGLSYWREQLAGEIPVLELPTDRPRPVVQSYRGAYHSFSFPDQLSQAIRQLSQRHGTTLFMTLLAGFNAVLHRYSGQQDIIVGTDIAGRNHAEIEPLIGFFVNQLVLRTDLSGEPHFLELLKRVRRVALESYSHQDVPFERLVEELQPQRDLGRAPLFQVKLVLQNAPTEALEQLPGLQIQRLGGESGAARFDLTIGMVEAGETIGGTAAYSTDLFDAATIQRLLSHFENVLSAAVANPEQPISELSLLDEAERQQILIEWNDTAVNHQRNICVHRLFEAQAECTPDAAAIFMDGEQVSYAELNARANQLAHHLRELGVGPDVLVGICVERSTEMIVALLGVMKAGGAYAPIDAQYPPDRISFMLDDAGISVMLTSSSLVEKLPSYWGYTVCLDADRHAFDIQPTGNLDDSATPDNLAYVIYTSGSTGRPKAVMTEHKALLARLLYLRDLYQLQETDRHLQLAAFGFDVAAEEILAPLISGGAVVLYSYLQARSGPELLREGITKLTATASYWHQLVADMDAANEPWPESMRLLVIGGESVSVEKLRSFAAQLKHPVRFFHAYGPTEATIVSTFFEVRLDDLNSLTRTPIGRPAGNTTIYVVDRHLQPVPVGVTGEILIGGGAVARGYLNRPDVTAERFIPDLFNIKDRGTRLYRTGDFGRYLADGTIEFIGRGDAQVKVRGYRIELGEIEAVLQRHPQVSEAVVAVRDEANGERRLVGYVTNGTSGSADVSVAELREYLQAQLPSYMVPQAVVMLSEFPRTPNGKVDRRGLPEPEPQLVSREDYSEARTATEELLVNIWSGVLRIEGVGTEQNFFELGGHSLLATQVIARVREVFSVELSLRTLFEQPTVSGLARSIEAALRKESQSLAPPLRRVSRDERLPLSFAQQRLWFLAELDPKSTFYIVPTAVRLQGQINFDALQQALNEIVRRHEVLRTSFRTIDGEPVQVISPPQPVKILREDAEDEETARRLMNDEANIAFDLNEGPLLRVKLLRLADDKHVLLLTMHHIISDGWSMGVLSKELTALYRSFNRGEESTLAELPVQYADYAVWQREWLQGEVLEGELAYWREQLGGDLQVLELPTDRPRGVLKTYKGASHPLSFSQRTTQALKELSRAHDCTLFMTVLAAFQTLLYRYSGQEQISVGSPIAGRNRVEIENLIGFFVNTLVLRTDLSGGPTFVELLKRVREMALGAYAHQQVPFEKLVEELQPQRDLSRSPLFQVMFHLQTAVNGPTGSEAETSSPTGLRLSLMGGQIETSKFELSVFLSEGDAGLAGSIEYNTDLFDELTIARLVRHFATLLDGVAEDPEQTIEALPLLSEQERRQLLLEWNDTVVEYPRAAGIHQLFEAQVERTPEAVALVFGEEQLTFAELNKRANQLAHHLRSLGVGPDVLVGICVERNLYLVIGLLGILKAGGAYVPLDPGYPAERLSFMLEDAGIAVLLSEEQLLDRLPTQWVLTFSMDGDWPQVAAYAQDNLLDASVLPENLAYVIYTSGSTGQPKGVLINHGGLLNYVQWAMQEYGLRSENGARHGAPLHSSISFDLSITSLWVPLLAGQSVVLVAEQIGVEGLVESLREQGPFGLVKLTPSHLEVLNQQLSAEELRECARVLVIGGEALGSETLRVWREQAPETRLVNEYGPTETVVGSCVYEVSEASGWVGAVPIGRAIANTQMYVLDRRMEPPAVGVVGELYIGGAGVGRGYLGRAELTAERFVPHPFSDQAGARLYRTGDMGRWRVDGELEFLGRVDEQVKVRGYRIELGEIESVLLGHGGVREAVVVAREERLVGYVVTDADTASLREYLAERLPSYMVPSVLVQLTELPLTPNGKVDRKALALREDVAERTEESVLPRTAVEELLASIWAGVLRVEGVGVEENFFELGGHSLLATQVIARILDVFGVELPLRSLFEQPTVAALAAKIEVALRGERGIAAPPLVRVRRERELPLSFAQQRLWFLDQLEPGSAFYNVPTAVRLHGQLNVEALEQTLTEIVRRHEVLRTTFESVNGEAVQVIGEAQPQRIPVTELSELEEDEREQRARELIDAEAQTPFDLSTGPLLRVRLLRLEPEEQIVLLTMHHIVSDGWSMGVLTSELMHLYRAYSAGEASLLPELPVQYADYAVWQREWLQGEVLEAELAYWRAQLGGELPVLALPTDRVRPAVQSYRGARVSFHLDAATTEQLRQLSRTQDCTLFMTLLAAFQTLLYRYSGQEEIVIGSPIAGRNRVELEELIGFFVNTLVLRTDLGGGPTFVELLKRVREVALGAYAHQEVPFEKLVDEIQPERDLSRSPLFQAMFVLENRAVANAKEKRKPTSKEGELRLWSMGTDLATAKFDLTLWLAEGAEVSGAIEYNTDLFDRTTIERMSQHFARLLTELAANPAQEIGAFALLSEAERRQLLAEWNDTAVEYPRASCLHELFEAQVERTPEAVALVFGEEQFTFAELNERANQLAHHLRSLGVGPDVLVGICVERNLHLVVGLLGILKAGGAYVPLDPGYPAGRLAYLMEDAQVRVLLTQKDVLQRLPELVTESVLCLDEQWPEIALQANGNVASGVAPENLAYVIYTSGSTGQPKGVLINHGGLLNYVQWAMQEYGLRSESGARHGAPLHSSISFDLSITSLWVPLLAGQSVVLVAEQVGVEGLVESLREQGPFGLVKLTPSHLEVLNQQLSAEELRECARVLVIGGEALGSETLRVWREQAPETRLVNEYGPTETVVGSCVYEVSEASGWSGSVPIGRAIANTQMYVLDRRMEPAAVGVVGELYIGGAGVAHGYLGRAELTAERFVPHPFSDQAGARLYRTGDIGRWRVDGELEFLGRVDEQVKVRGYRIELGEIESVLLGHGGVREAVVVAREERLVAYVVTDADTASLREYLAERLPSYMVPSVLVQLTELPLTPNGKVDRKALALREDVAERAKESVVPRTAVEELLASIWAGVLRVEGIGIEENFFALGGHSLLATQVMSRVREVFGVEVPLRSLFEQPTVAGLAAKIEAALRGDRGIAAPPFVRVSREQALPLSFAQQRLWFLDQLEPGSAFYNLHNAVRLKGELHVPRLEQTLTEIVRRHEVLRTTFQSIDGEVVQVISPAQDFNIAIEDLSCLPDTEREAAVRQLVTEEGKAPFDLSNGPLLRVKLLKLATDEYVVLLTMHHIIGDGWSMGLLVNEIGSLYQAFTNDQSSPLPELPIQYADYAVWQRDWLEGEVLEGELRYWRKQLGGELPVLELPADRPRPAVESYKGAYHSVEFSQHISSGVKELSQRHGCTLYMTLLAAFNTLFHRYSGQDDIITGTAIAGRNRAEVEPLIGLFVNSLAMRTDLSGDPTFVQLLGRVREMALGAYAHQDVPFEKLVEELNPVRDLSRSPLYQVMLILQNEPSADVLNLSGGTPRTRAGEIGTAKMDLLLSLFERGGKLLGHIEYNTDLFDAATIERTLEHFENLLRTIPELAQRPISELQILSDEEREQLLVTWNTAPTDFPRDRSLHQLFEEQAKRAPQAAAVAFGPQQLTYAELNARANQLAHHLRSLGVGAETRVGVYLERGIEMIVALLGIMKAGGAYVPIDPQVPQARLEFMLADADVTVLVTQQELSSSTAGTTIVFLDADWSNIAALPATDLQQASSADNLAYVIYTSGSTGLPKGVMVPHRNVVALVNALLPRLDVKERDVWTLVHSIAFDFSVWEIWGALLSGGKLVVVPELIVSSPAEFEELLRSEQVTVINQTPSAAAQLLGAGNGNSWQARGLSVKQVFVGGEALSADLAHSLIAMGAPVWNFYGPTEATVWAALKLLSAQDEEVTIGRPISNWQLYVLDHRHELLPVGVPGELYIGGEGLARGYLNRADLTAEKFIPNPCGRSARLYRTGDVARYKPNGEIEFVGRADHQVKLRGYRIELGEVEAALLEHPQVREAVALVRERQSGDRQLVAYVSTGELPANEEMVNSRVLIELVRKALPKYMVPATVVVMDQLPRTSNGKIDRKALPEPDYTTASESEFVGARTSLEEILAGIWEQVLSVEQVGAHDNFFDLGGHSLLATQVVSRIRETFGVNISLRSLFEHQTIARLSGAVESSMREHEGPEAPPLRPVERDRALPLSFAQQRLWFLDQLEPQKAIYNYSSAVRLRGPLDLEALERTLTEIVRRHEVLRTTFQSIDGEVVQVISPLQPVKLEVVDITSRPEAHREAEARRRISEEAAQPFNLSDGPLLRFKLLKSDDEDHTIALTMHHIISDRWSVGILIKEVSAIYQAFINGQPSPLPELPVQYADYAVWQREWLKGEVLEKEIDYWRQQLGGALSELRLPVVRQRPVVPSYRGAYHSFRLEPTLSSSLKRLSREQGCTLFMTLLAAFQTLIYRYTQQDDILVGTTIAGRNRTELENLIGFFVNTLPMRADLSGEPSFIDLLKRVREFALGAYVHQELPFEKLVEELHPERGPDSALVRVFFGLQNAPATSLELPGLKLNAVGYSSDAVRFDLTLWMEEGPGGLTGTWTYSTDVLDVAAIAQMHERFETLLQSIVDKPETTLRLLDIIGPTERMQKAASRSERESRNAEKLTLKKRKAVAMGTEPQT